MNKKNVFFINFNKYVYEEENPELNMTPLIDVLLVLMALFLVLIGTERKNPTRINVELPIASQGSVAATEIIPILSIDKDKKLFWNQVELKKTLKDFISAFPVPPAELLIQAHYSLTWQDMVRILDVLLALKVGRFGFLTHPPAQQPIPITAS
jgi:biopolymer transport protein ExbD